MKTVHRRMVACALALASGVVLAQTASTPGAGPGKGMPGAGPPASAPGMGMGPGAGHGKGARWGSDYTPGWSMMTEAERQAHQDRMRSMTTQSECKAYLEQHREQMAARAKDRGGKALGQPRHDACGMLPR